MSFKNLLIYLIIALALFVRFYNYAERTTFGPEQAISLITSGSNIKSKFTLLGQENVQRVTSKGHVLFSGSPFTYSLIPLQKVFDYQPLPISKYFALLNVLTGAVLFFVVKKMFNWPIAFFSTLLFLFNDYMIYHSMFIWILNYLPLLGAIALHLLFKRNNQRDAFNTFLLGVLSGVGFGLEYVFLFTALVIFTYLIYRSKNKIKTAIIFIIGSIVGNLPMIVFDLRHDFYHLRSLWQYFLDTLLNPGQSSITYYHFLQFWPLFALLGGIFLFSLWKNYRAAAISFIGFYLAINLFSGQVSFNYPIGMPVGLSMTKVFKMASDISQDKPANFNVVSLLDFDTRGHILRYPLEFLFGTKPLGREDYKEAQSLYVLSETSYDFSRPTVWEINIFEPKNVELFSEVDNRYAVYKLTK